MDFDQINNVSDLIEANKDEKSHEDTVSELMSPVYQHDPIVGHQCAIDILQNLLGYHQDMVNQYIEEGNSKDAAIWAIDLNRIDMAITILNDVKL